MKRSRTPGRITFTASARCVPSASWTIALWTCAMEAAAIGSLNDTKS